ncbi:BRO-N domain-containing protein [Jonquetella anthropi]|uniref:BRO-N domain-containing protein n=1 Tax=Jonquetella anthropi TaxID=428712 RepID=UPI0023F023DF|nr:Bro-N domain-containing protein [Jonquetella anthropi]
MNELQVFAFNDHLVRTVQKDGEPWWVAKDVCEVLGLGNPRTSLALLEDDEKGVHSMDTLGGTQSVTVINESGLYNLIFRSRKDEARAFRRWVTHEVLPQIRRTGTYKAPTVEEFDKLIAQARRGDKDVYNRLVAEKARRFGIDLSKPVVPPLLECSSTAEAERILREFLPEQFPERPCTVRVADLYGHLHRWGNARGDKIPAKRSVGSALKRLGMKPGRRHQGRFWVLVEM